MEDRVATIDSASSISRRLAKSPSIKVESSSSALSVKHQHQIGQEASAGSEGLAAPATGGGQAASQELPEPFQAALQVSPVSPAAWPCNTPFAGDAYLDLSPATWQPCGPPRQHWAQQGPQYQWAQQQQLQQQLRPGEAQQQNGADSSAAWLLFCIGWVFPVCWLVAALLPLCQRGRRASKRDRLAAVASAAMLAVYLLLLALGIAVSMHAAAKAASAAVADDGGMQLSVKHGG